MLKSILTVMVLASMTCCFFPARFAKAQTPDGAASDEFQTSGERIGGLRLGLPEKDVNRNISCVPGKAKEILQGATGVYIQMWNYPKCGIVLKMSSERKGGAKTVESITITSPGDLVTGNRIHIGSTESEVIKAYGRYRDQASRSCPTRRIDAREAVSLPATRSCASPGAGHAGDNEHAEASGAGEVREAKSIHRIRFTF